MKIFFLCLLLLNFSENAFAKSKQKSKKNAKSKTSQTPKAAKLTKDDAKELCLINNGASISDKELDSCTEKTMKAGKFVK